MSELQPNFVSRLGLSDWWFFVEHYNINLKRWDIQSLCFFLASSQSSRTSQWDEFNHPEKSREAAPPQVDQLPPDLDTDQNWPGGRMEHSKTQKQHHKGKLWWESGLSEVVDFISNGKSKSRSVLSQMVKATVKPYLGSVCQDHLCSVCPRLGQF